MICKWRYYEVSGSFNGSSIANTHGKPPTDLSGSIRNTWKQGENKTKKFIKEKSHLNDLGKILINKNPTEEVANFIDKHNSKHPASYI